MLVMHTIGLTTRVRCGVMRSPQRTWHQESERTRRSRGGLLFGERGGGEQFPRKRAELLAPFRADKQEAQRRFHEASEAEAARFDGISARASSAAM